MAPTASALVSESIDSVELNYNGSGDVIRVF